MKTKKRPTAAMRIAVQKRKKNENAARQPDAFLSYAKDASLSALAYNGSHRCLALLQSRNKKGSKRGRAQKRPGSLPASMDFAAQEKKNHRKNDGRHRLTDTFLLLKEKEPRNVPGMKEGH